MYFIKRITTIISKHVWKSVYGVYLTWGCRLNLYLLVRIVFNKKNIKGKFQIMNISKTYIYARAIETFPSTFQFRHIKRRHLFKLLSINKILLHFCCGFFLDVNDTYTIKTCLAHSVFIYHPKLWHFGLDLLTHGQSTFDLIFRN